MTAPSGQTGWLFGTVHALPDGVAWDTPQLDNIAANANTLLVEIANLNDPRGATMFRTLAHSDNLPPLFERVPPADRELLASLLNRTRTDESDFNSMESWAAAVQLSNALSPGKAENGVDRALGELGMPVIGLESFESQLSIFDNLPEAEQVDLLLAVAQSSTTDSNSATELWLTGDMAGLELLAESGILGDPELRDALHTSRNRAWLAPIVAAIENGRQPLIAVGAAHMLGEDGLPALLEEAGYTVTRIQ